jgi:hypothetical protein
MNVQHSNSYTINTNGFSADFRKIFDPKYESTREQLHAYINNSQKQINQLMYANLELMQRVKHLEQKIERNRR